MGESLRCCHKTLMRPEGKPSLIDLANAPCSMMSSSLSVLPFFGVQRGIIKFQAFEFHIHPSLLRIIALSQCVSILVG
jgi:hypothetical protein